MLSGISARLSCAFSACATGSATLLASGLLGAQEPGPTLLSYRAADGCPEVGEFQRSVERRSSHIHFVDEGTHDRELSIVISKDGDFTRGELRLIERDGGLRQRSVRFTSCAEAVEGLALITAVSLDPQALLEPATPAPEPPKPAVSAPPSPPPAAPVTPAKRATLRASRAAHVEAGVGAAFSVAPSALPGSALGGTLFVDVASASPAWFAPLARASFNHVERRGLATAESKINFALTLATLSLCPVRFGGRTLVARPCAFATGGALRPWGSEAAAPRVSNRPYYAWGGSLLLFVRLSQVLDFIGDVALGPALIRDTFTFNNQRFGKTPALYLSNDVGLRFAFR